MKETSCCLYPQFFLVLLSLLKQATVAFKFVPVLHTPVSLKWPFIQNNLTQFIEIHNFHLKHILVVCFRKYEDEALQCHIYCYISKEIYDFSALVSVFLISCMQKYIEVYSMVNEGQGIWSLKILLNVCVLDIHFHSCYPTV